MNPENQDKQEDMDTRDTENTRDIGDILERPDTRPETENAGEPAAGVDHGADAGEEGAEKRPLIQEAFEWVESLVVAMLFVVLVFTFVGRTVIVDGPSMLPTLRDKDALVVTRLTGAPKPGDIVAITKLSAIDRPLIKRVIAVGGQTIDIDGGTGDVYVDGRLLSEPFINEYISPDPYYDEIFPMVVPENGLFIMGDNRNNSWDSRSSLGVVDEKNVLGKVVFRYLPFDSIGSPK